MLRVKSSDTQPLKIVKKSSMERTKQAISSHIVFTSLLKGICLQYKPVRVADRFVAGLSQPGMEKVTDLYLPTWAAYNG
eukprot:1136272-Pelagomonas_calceolata.AAC.1